MKSFKNISDLMIFDCLEVQLAKLESNRLIATYRLLSGDKDESTELIYRYEEPVFTPDEPASINLACIIAAQVAINYGLFCKTIRFIGLFDDRDRRLIRTMMENTAREIYVKKFLEENPFLEGFPNDSAPIKSKKYSNATIQFKNSGPKLKKLSWELWSVNENRHTVLSSGGKDSLLSFGLLNEIFGNKHTSL